MEDVVIISGVRTPIGKFQGSLEPFSAPQLGAVPVREAVKRASVEPAQVHECIMGLAVAGGMESMTNAPYLLPQARKGYRLGNSQIIDSVVNDGLWDIYNNYHMGMTGENVAQKYGVTREQQDEYAVGSHQKAVQAWKECRFKSQIVPVELPAKKKGEAHTLFEKDEGPREDTTAAALGNLKPVFKKDGTVTAGNASTMNDGAAAVVVTSASRAKQLGAQPMVW